MYSLRSLGVTALLLQSGIGCPPRLRSLILVLLQPFKPSSFKEFATVLIEFGKWWGKKLAFVCFKLHWSVVSAQCCFCFGDFVFL